MQTFQIQEELDVRFAYNTLLTINDETADMFTQRYWGVMRKYLNPQSEPTGGCWGGGGAYSAAGSNS